MSLAGDDLRLFKFVPDEFVVHLPRYSACGLASTGQRKHWSRHSRLDTEETNVTLREVLLDSKLVFSKPQDRLFAGQIDRMDRFAL
ncbi:hypothetical protein MJL81_09015, partial [Salmonella enterica subsp. enterica serovar Anatum]|nr:hypothetical protein [Salmonella enterica subsp. enterica serovar Anatum]